MTIKFDIRHVADRSRRDLERRRDILIQQYADALGGYASLNPQRRFEVERAAHLMSLAQGQRALAADISAKDEADLKRLEGLAAAAVEQLGIKAA